MRIGEGYESAKPFLRPSGKLASSHPCTERRPCECAHAVVEHGPEDIVAVCRCGRGCTTFPLNRSEIAVYELDRTAFDQAVAGAFNLMGEPHTENGLHQTTRIGVYSPYAGFRFPVYLTIQLEPDDFHHIVSGLVSRTDEPFVLLAPTHDLCTAPTELHVGKSEVGLHSAGGSPRPSRTPQTSTPPTSRRHLGVVLDGPLARS